MMIFEYCDFREVPLTALDVTPLSTEIWIWVEEREEVNEGPGFIITTLIMTIKLGAAHYRGRLRVKMGRHHSSHQHPAPTPRQGPASAACILVPISFFTQTI